MPNTELQTVLRNQDGCRLFHVIIDLGILTQGLVESHF